MSKGSQRITVRVGSALLKSIELAVERRNVQPGGVEKTNITGWILQAIVDKLNHSERSRRTGKKCKFVEEEVDGQAFRHLVWTEADCMHTDSELLAVRKENGLDNDGNIVYPQ